MTLKAFRQQVLDELAEQLAPAGYRRREQSFYREAGSVRHVLHVAIIPHTSDFDITADVAVRHHAVEELLNAQVSHLSPREKRQTATVGAELGNLAGVGQHRWTVAHESDVRPAVLGILEWFERLGQPFLERFSSAATILRVLDQGGDEARLICPFPDRWPKVRAALRTVLEASAV